VEEKLLVMDDAESDSRASFQLRLRRVFTDEAIHMVLKARDCVAERLSTQELSNQIRAVDILLGQSVDAMVVTCALLLPLRRQGRISTDDIQHLFGGEVASLVERVLSHGILRTDTEEHRREDLQRFLESVSTDIRVIILRLTLRLAELEGIATGNGHEHQPIAQETLDLYVPLAGRMGMGALRTQLEDVCFRRLKPLVYGELERNLAPVRAEDEVCLELLKAGVRDLLKEEGVEAQIYGRRKGLYSIYRKMQRLQRPLEEVMDRIGLRIIVSSVKECYAVLGLLHNRFRPVAGTFDDYIALPKENGYQSLHTCVYPVPDISLKPVEFQIRTETMNRQAEFGIAAHWLYKSQDEAALDSERQLQWLRSLLPQRTRASSHAEFIEGLHRQVFDDRLVVFDEAGRPVRLPADATVTDFIERHGEPRRAISTTQVNQVPRPMDYPLRDGDTVCWSGMIP
jgi:(p)ppGpp synthase/HD superfamily hydrolase